MADEPNGAASSSFASNGQQNSRKSRKKLAKLAKNRSGSRSAERYFKKRKSLLERSSHESYDGEEQFPYEWQPLGLDLGPGHTSSTNELSSSTSRILDLTEDCSVIFEPLIKPARLRPRGPNRRSRPLVKRRRPATVLGLGPQAQPVAMPSAMPSRSLCEPDSNQSISHSANDANQTTFTESNYLPSTTELERNDVDGDQYNSDLSCGEPLDDETSEVVLEADRSSNNQLTVKPGTINQCHYDVKSVLNSYVIELARHQGILAIDALGKSFVLNGFCFEHQTNELSLQNSEFLFVSRRGHCFNGNEWHWIYSCSCSKQESQINSCLGRYIKENFKEFETKMSYCLHIRATIVFEEPHDDEYGFSPHLDASRESIPFISDIDQFYPMIGKNLVCVRKKTEYGVVDLSCNPYLCLTCNFHCSHLKSLEEGETRGSLPDWLLDLLPSENDVNAKMKTANVSTTASESAINAFNCTIPFDLCEPLITILRNGVARSFATSEDSNKLLICPSSMFTWPQKCDRCGNDFSSGDPIKNNWVFSTQGLLVERNAVHDCIVFYRPCSAVGCPGLSLIDGTEFGFINMGFTMVSFAVLRDYMYHFLHGRMTMYTYYNVLKKQLNELGFQTTMFTYNKFRFCWYAFLKRLDIDYKAGLSCVECKSHPEIVLGDGTALGFQTRFIKLDSLIETSSCDKSMDVALSGSKYSERVYIRDKGTQEFLSEIARDVTKFTKDAIQNVLLGLRQTNSCLTEFIAFCIQKFGTDCPFPDGISRFLLSLSKSSPVCALIPPNDKVVDIIKRYIASLEYISSRTDLTEISLKCPILFGLLCEFSEPHIPVSLANLLSDILPYTTAPFSHDNQPSITQTVDMTGMEDPNTMSYFPALPLVRDRGVFKADKSNAKDYADTKFCRKKYGRHPTLIPGIFTMFCGHGFCYGFQVMKSNESPDVPFTLLFTRFPTAPKTVIYDNSCNLHQYFLNRTPCFVKSTRFLVDRLHWLDHVGCSMAYNMDIYSEYDALNSQITEQTNSGLDRIKGSLSYMKQENFLLHCKFYLWYKNRQLENQKA